MFIQTEDTPNPLTLKFIPGREVLAGQPVYIASDKEAWRVPLAERLFEISGVTGSFFGSDFISVTKTESSDWNILRPQVLGSIMEYFMAHESLEVHESKEVANESTEEDSEIVQEIKEMLETRIRPAVAQDGGDIIFNRFENGIVYLELQGACSGCPSSSVTLKNGIENMLRHYIPEVNEVRAV